MVLSLKIFKTCFIIFIDTSDKLYVQRIHFESNNSKATQDIWHLAIHVSEGQWLTAWYDMGYWGYIQTRTPIGHMQLNWHLNSFFRVGVVVKVVVYHVLNSLPLINQAAFSSTLDRFFTNSCASLSPTRDARMSRAPFSAKKTLKCKSIRKNQF